MRYPESRDEEPERVSGLLSCSVRSVEMDRGRGQLNDPPLEDVSVGVGKRGTLRAIAIHQSNAETR